MLRGFLTGMGRATWREKDLQTAGKGAIIISKRIEYILNKDWEYSKYAQREQVK